MGIVALSFIVLFVEGTPLSLKIEHVEVSILLHEVDNPCLDVSPGVSERAVVTVLAVMQKFGELCAEFSFVLFNMVQSFNFTVCKWTSIFAATFVSLLVLAKIC